ncbi:MAG TPA: hypothetical protein VGJ82_01590 [Thermoanaerobaculia bacterium]|jgi:hypothetical protein
MAIVLPFPLTIQEMRVLQEFRRFAADTLEAATIKAIKHPAGGGEAPAQSLVSKGFLTSNGSGGYSLTEKAKEFLAIDAKPMFEGSGGDEAAAE